MNNDIEKTHSPLKNHLDSLGEKKQSDFRKFVVTRLGKSSRTTLFNWLKGTHQPNQSEKERIARFLKVDVATIF